MALEDYDENVFYDEDTVLYSTDEGDVTVSDEEEYDPYSSDNVSLSGEGDYILDEDTAITDWNLEDTYEEQDTTDDYEYDLESRYDEVKADFWEEENKLLEDESGEVNWLDALLRDHSTQDVEKIKTAMKKEKDSDVLDFLKKLGTNERLWEILAGAGLALGSRYLSQRDKKKPVVRKGGGGGGGRKAEPAPVSALGGQMGRVAKRSEL